MNRMNFIRASFFAISVLFSCQKISEPAIVKVQDITLNKTSIVLTVGETETVLSTVSPSNADNQKVIWSTGNSSIANVNAGVVQAVSKGKTSIFAKTDDGGKIAVCDVIVEELFIPINNCSIDQSNFEITEGRDTFLTYTFLPVDATSKEIVWASSNSEVATVGQNGHVVAQKPGIAVISVSTADKSCYDDCVVTVLQKKIPISRIDLNTEDISLWPTESVLITATIIPEDATVKGVVQWKSTNESVATVTDGLVTAVNEGTTNIIATVGDVSKTCSVLVYRTRVKVDLGLSVKWAACNIGASLPWEQGTFYAWGETEGKETYTRSNYKWFISSANVTKYNTNSSYGPVDNLTVLELSDDAGINWSVGWRTPTVDEWQELIDKCNWEWTTIHGVKGMVVTSRVEGYTNNSIFLPINGISREGEVLYQEFGYYWTSLLSTNSRQAIAISFDADRYDFLIYYSRHIGTQVRAVNDKF